MEQNIKELKEQLSKFRKQSDSILDRIIHVLSRGDEVEEDNEGIVTIENILDSISVTNAIEIEYLYKEFNAISMTLNAYKDEWNKRMEKLINNMCERQTFDVYNKIVLMDVDKNLYEFRKFMNSVHENAKKFLSSKKR
jgi:hypothetical protein